VPPDPKEAVMAYLCKWKSECPHCGAEVEYDPGVTVPNDDGPQALAKCNECGRRSWRPGVEILG